LDGKKRREKEQVREEEGVESKKAEKRNKQ
jgi:hypothetical protein